MDDVLNLSVIKGTEEMFESVLGWKVTGSAPVEKQIGEAKSEVSVIISFVGAVSGAFVLKCSKKFAAAIASQMLGMEVGEESDDMKDAVGELLNMVVGNAKTYYASKKEGFKISVPSTVIGEDYVVHIKANNGNKMTCINFKCDNNDLSIEIYLN